MTGSSVHRTLLGSVVFVSTVGDDFFGFLFPLVDFFVVFVKLDTFYDCSSFPDALDLTLMESSSCFLVLTAMVDAFFGSCFTAGFDEFVFDLDLTPYVVDAFFGFILSTDLFDADDGMHVLGNLCAT